MNKETFRLLYFYFYPPAHLVRKAATDFTDWHGFGSGTQGTQGTQEELKGSGFGFRCRPQYPKPDLFCYKPRLQRQRGSHHRGRLAGPMSQPQARAINRRLRRLSISRLPQIPRRQTRCLLRPENRNKSRHRKSMELARNQNLAPGKATTANKIQPRAVGQALLILSHYPLTRYPSYVMPRIHLVSVAVL